MKLEHEVIVLVVLAIVLGLLGKWMEPTIKTLVIVAIVIWFCLVLLRYFHVWAP